MISRLLQSSFVRLLVVLLVLSLGSVACNTLGSGPYEETFDSAGTWGSGSTSEVEGDVNNGVYEMLVKSNSGLYLATAGESFGDGIYEVEAIQVDGPLNNGYGMLFRMDDATDSFYVFEVSGDGFVWIGYCDDLCDTEAVALVGGDWFPSPAVKQGLQQNNHLRLVADGTRMTFFVNGVEVGRTSDSRLTEGDIAVMVEALGERGVRVIFDNFKVTPLSDS
jgi:hypothetical protein